MTAGAHSEPHEVPETPPAVGSRRPLAVLLGLALAAFALGLGRDVRHSMGWDESMHVAAPAARMAVGLREGRLSDFNEALLGCDQYPPVVPLLVAAAELGFGGLDGDDAPGDAERIARGTITALAALALLLCGLAAFELGQVVRPGSRAGWIAAGVAAGLFAASPLVQAYSSTLFLEVPAACSVAFCLWLRARAVRDPSPLREVALGLGLAAAFFIKFNYGVLLVAALATDALAGVVSTLLQRRADPSTRGGAALAPLVSRRDLLALLRVAAPLALACAWWFVLPFPGGLADASSHRAAFLGFLTGNLQLESAPTSHRLLHLLGYLHPAPLAGVVALAAAALSLRYLREPNVRCAVIMAAALGVPALTHPFHLDRFLVPAAPALFACAGVGVASFARSTSRLAAALTLLVVTSLAGPWQCLATARLFGAVPEAAVEQARTAFEGWSGPLASRHVPTAGLERDEHDALLDLVAAAVRPGERWGWLGLSSELSPAVIALGLYARGGSAERFLAEVAAHPDVQPVPQAAPPPGFDARALERHVAGLDLVFLTDPPDLKGRASRRWVRESLHRVLAEELGWLTDRVGVVPVTRPGGGAVEVSLFACRRP